MNRTAIKLLAASAAYFQLDETGAKRGQPRGDRFNKKVQRITGRDDAASKRRASRPHVDWR